MFVYIGRKHAEKNAEVLVVARKNIGLEVIADKLSTWLCVEIRIQDDVTI